MGSLTLFAGAGVGAYFVTLNAEIDTANLDSFDVDDQDTVLGTHDITGGYYKITPRIFVGLEGLYSWTTIPYLKCSVGLITTNWIAVWMWRSRDCTKNWETTLLPQADQNHLG